MKYAGLWLPIITPFKNDTVDFTSYQKLIDYYIKKGVTGIIPLGTTGESPTISEYEYESILTHTMEYVSGRVPVLVGLGNNNTGKLVKDIKLVERLGVQGILSVTPYYNRPDQRGIFEHFKTIAESTRLDIVVYNIPYRTGRNIELDTLYRLAEITNIVGVKDCNGDFSQTISLLLNPPADFSVLTGEDHLFYTTLLHGGHGGILASCHLQTEKYLEVYQKLQNNDFKAAFSIWKEIIEMIPLLFKEPNPAPLKYCLHKMGLIDTQDCRMPILPITEKLKKNLDTLLLHS